MKNSKIFVNPAAGGGKGRRVASAVVRYLGERGLKAPLVTSRGPRDLTRQVSRAAVEGVDTFIVVGGDGSVSEAVNGMLAAGSRGALGVVPVGTGNDFLKSLGVAPKWRQACDVMLASQTGRPIDVGRVNNRFFVNTLGIGFDAEVTLATEGVRVLRGDMVYAFALLKALLAGIRTPTVKLRHDTGEIEQSMTLIAVCNGEWEGGRFHIAPQARLDDGLLDVVFADRLNRRGVLRLVPKVMRGTHLDAPTVTHLRSARVHIEAAEPMPVHADGEILERGARELEIELVPKALRVLVLETSRSNALHIFPRRQA